MIEKCDIAFERCITVIFSDCTFGYCCCLTMIELGRTLFTINHRAKITKADSAFIAENGPKLRHASLEVFIPLIF